MLALAVGGLGTLFAICVGRGGTDPSPDIGAVDKSGRFQGRPLGARDRKPLAADGPSVRRIRGRVLHEAGEPAPGAEVSVHRTGVPAVSLTADADGNFATDPLEEGATYRLSARDGLQRSQAVTVLVESTDRELTLQMVTSDEVVIRTVDAQNRPIAEAIVKNDQGPLVIADQDGIARFQGLAAPRQSFQIEADSFVPRSLLVEFSHDTTPITRTVQLGRGVNVAGRLVDTAGTPIPDGWLAAASGSSESTRHETDAGGRWEVTLGSGVYELRGFARGYASGKLRVELDGITAKSDVEIRLAALPAITGRVLSDGMPAGQAIVMLYQDDSEWRNYVTTSNDGAFRLACGDVRGGCSISAIHDGKSSIPMDAECDASVILVVSEASVITGTVTAPPGLSTQGATVLVESSDREEPTIRVPLEPDGSFRTGGLVAGRYQLAAQWQVDTSEPAGDAWTVANAGDENIELRLDAPIEIRGRVRMNGHPVTPFALAFADSRPQLARQMASPALGVPRVIRAASGAFRIGPVPPGARSLIVIGPSFGRRVVPLGLQPGVNDLGDLDVHPPSMITGTVVTTGGRPIVDADVQVREPGSLGGPSEDPYISILDGIGRARTDGNGAYAVPVQHPAAWGYEVAIERTGYRPRLLHVTAGHHSRVILVTHD